ncbi:MAG TPA: hypothetical protein VEQ11_15820 [Chloroflexota bacterium]|nr:hypothetical protein [Chloroflexota bacterium]
MAKSLKEALLEKFADLQELGIAPASAPVEEEGPPVVVEMGPESRREAGGRRQRPSRATGYDDELGRSGDQPPRPRSRPRRAERGERPRAGPGDRARRRGEQSESDERFPVGEIAPVETRPTSAGRPAPTPPRAGDRAPAPQRPPIGSRPPFGERQRPGQRFGGPNDGAPRLPGVTERLRQRAEERRREEVERSQLQSLLGATVEGELGTEAYDKFLADLTQEVGALPPLERVIEAVRLAGSSEPFKVGEQIRQLYRRPRPRPAALPN